MTKYFSQLLDQYIEQGFEGKRTINYYAELGTDMLVLGLTLLQYLQLMVTYFSTITIVCYIEKKRYIELTLIGCYCLKSVDAWNVIWISGYCIDSQCAKRIKEPLSKRNGTPG